MVNKVAVITGGSSGIGLAVAKKLILQEYTVFNFDIQPPAEQLEMQSFQVDIRNFDEIQAAVAQIIKIHKSIGYLFSNSGTHYSGDLENTPLDVIDSVIDINLKGTLYILKSVLPFMREQNFGRIVLNSSDQALVGKANSTIYGCTKAATSQIAKSIAVDYSQFNININAICPGTIDTPLYQKAISNYCKKSGEDESKVHQEEANLQPLKRIGKPEEVAHLVAFLFSDEANFMTGSNISIDGGYTAK